MSKKRWSMSVKQIKNSFNWTSDSVVHEPNEKRVQKYIEKKAKN